MLHLRHETNNSPLYSQNRHISSSLSATLPITYMSLTSSAERNCSSTSSQFSNSTLYGEEVMISDLDDFLPRVAVWLRGFYVSRFLRSYTSATSGTFKDPVLGTTGVDSVASGSFEDPAQGCSSVFGALEFTVLSFNQHD